MVLLTSQLTRTPTIQRNQTSLLLNSHFSPFLKWGFSETVLPSLSLFLLGEVHTAAGCLCVDEPPLSFALSAAAPPNPPVLSWDSKSAAPSTSLSSTKSSSLPSSPKRRRRPELCRLSANFCGDGTPIVWCLISFWLCFRAVCLKWTWHRRRQAWRARAA